MLKNSSYVANLPDLRTIGKLSPEFFSLKQLGQCIASGVSTIAGIGTVILLGFVYCIAAIPTGVALGIPIAVAGIAAWVGYSLGAVIVVVLGAPLREWLAKKLKFDPHPANPGIVHRAWKRFGLPALGLLAPVTIGPQIGALLGLTLGADKTRLVTSLSLGVLPWLLAFALLTFLGVQIVQPE